MQNPLHGKSGPHLSRRGFLLGTTTMAISATALISNPFSALAKGTTNTKDLHQVAEFVTGKSLDESLTARAGDAITTNNSEFPKALAALKSFISENEVSDVDELQATPGFEGDLRETAKTLISALYLGYSGTPKAQSSEDNVQFVTFTQALTYRLTHPYTPIPSYSRWGSGYWAHLPSAS